MRTYGRVSDANGKKTWVEYQTDANGWNDACFLCALEQWILLNLGESPFYANAGIPAFQSVVTQVFPDFYVMQAQSYFAQFFPSISISRVPGSNPPVYNGTIVTHSGANLQLTTIGNGMQVFGQ